jgi:hypothetical protein
MGRVKVVFGVGVGCSTWNLNHEGERKRKGWQSRRKKGAKTVRASRPETVKQQGQQNLGFGQSEILPQTLTRTSLKAHELEIRHGQVLQLKKKKKNKKRKIKKVAEETRGRTKRNTPARLRRTNGQG